VKADHRLTALFWRANLCIAGKLPTGSLWRWAIREHRFHGMMRGTTPGELDGANRGDLSIREVGILGFEINDELAHGDRKRAVMILSLRFRRPEETNDAMRVKGISGSTQAPFRQARFLRPFCWWNAEKHDRPDPLIQALLWGSTPLLEQMIVGLIQTLVTPGAS